MLVGVLGKTFTGLVGEVVGLVEVFGGLVKELVGVLAEEFGFTSSGLVKEPLRVLVLVGRVVPSMSEELRLLDDLLGMACF